MLSHIKSPTWYWFSLCFPHELLMIFECYWEFQDTVVCCLTESAILAVDFVNGKSKTLVLFPCPTLKNTDDEVFFFLFSKLMLVIKLMSFVSCSMYAYARVHINEKSTNMHITRSMCSCMLKSQGLAPILFKNATLLLVNFLSFPSKIG